MLRKPVPLTLKKSSTSNMTYCPAPTCASSPLPSPPPPTTVNNPAVWRKGPRAGHRKQALQSSVESVCLISRRLTGSCLVALPLFRPSPSLAVWHSSLIVRYSSPGHTQSVSSMWWIWRRAEFWIRDVGRPRCFSWNDLRFQRVVGIFWIMDQS